MEPAILGLILDSSALIAGERRKLTPAQVVEDVVKKIGAVPIILSALTIAEIGHGIYRAKTVEIQERRRAFLDELKATIPIHPITEATAEIIARVGGEQAAKGIQVPLADLIVGACALELSYAIGTSNIRDFPANSWLESAIALTNTLGPT